MKLKLLDLGCCQGGASEGYRRAGFEVLGVDLVRQQRYPFPFEQGDMLTFPFEGFDVLHASVPCQHDSRLHARWKDREYPNLLAAMRARFLDSGKPWIIECVELAEFHSGITLCGSMWGLQYRRHRTFESSHLLYPPGPCRHKEQGKPICITGHGGHEYHHPDVWREIMECPWMNRYGMAQAIPPIYSEYLGRLLQSMLDVGAA